MATLYPARRQVHKSLQEALPEGDPFTRVALAQVDDGDARLARRSDRHVAALVFFVEHPRDIARHRPASR
jgi:hypothetical protein